MPSSSYKDLQAHCAQLEAKVVKLEEDNGCMRKQILSEDLLVGKDNLTRFYTGFPTYHSFKSFVDYIKPKALRLRTKRSKQPETEEKESSHSRKPPRPWSSLSIATQLLAILVRLRLSAPALDISTRLGISEATYSRLFATWIPFLARELKLLFPFPSRTLIDSWMHPCISNVLSKHSDDN